MTQYEADLKDHDAIKSIAEEHGFCLVRNVFAPDEVEKIKAGLKETHETFGKSAPDLLSCPELAWVPLDERIVGIARKLLGDELVYYAESNINYEAEIGPLTLSPYSELHCDAMGTRENIWKGWSSPENALFGAYRFGMYFHDYGTSSGALKVAVGSHRGDAGVVATQAKTFTEKVQVRLGKFGANLATPAVQLYDVPARPGDAVVWNLRTFHAAGAKRLQGAQNVALHPDVEKQLESQLPDAFLPPPGPRLALFFDYGAPVESTDLYIKNRTLVRTLKNQNSPDMSYDSADIVAEARRRGVSLRFDYLIAALSVGLSEDRIFDPDEAVERLLHMLDAYKEFSPYHALLQPEKFQAARKINAREAVVGAVNDVVARINEVRQDYLFQRGLA